MNGLLALAGSGEYLPVMEDVDRYLLASLSLNGRKPRVVCLPTAAGREGDASVNRWSDMGVAHFEKLDADVKALRILDRESADDPQWESALETADLIYFSGGDPGYLYETMHGSRAWSAAMRAWERGAIYAGCSAGAMILARRIPRLRLAQTQTGFAVIPAEFIIPHFDAIPVMFKPFVFALRRQLREGERIIGVDEETALVGRLGGEWRVMGRGSVHLFTKKGEQVYLSGQILTLD
ncbi:MAG: Type 1 glutamine amidotransferase-like domain-containing protein [Chloroflexota bacterium]|nr:Type 1 glutamine amidotransferase-like domain-containing protein [Chloroflexota bacterium]MBI5704085.1 Type 1 glutamine amidotransferase-like domain-containing protein [Chloroflexota bacterium]